MIDMKYDMRDATIEQANNHANKISTTWNRWLGADGLPSGVGSTSTSKVGFESPKEI